MDALEPQRILDEEHLRLLRLGFLIEGAITAAIAALSMLYVAMGALMALDVMPASPGAPGTPPGSTALAGAIFAGMGFAAMAVLGTLSALRFVTARNIGQRRGRTFCMVVSGITCLGFPYGTVLGACALTVLSRPSVRMLFEVSPGQQPEH